MTTLFTNIRFLAGVRDKTQLLRGQDLAVLPVLENAFLLIEDGRIVDYGEMRELSLKVPAFPQATMDCKGQMLMPAWCDSHTHIVFAKSREEEFVDKIKGKTYAEIAASGGGILNSARLLAEMSEDELFNNALERLQAVAAMGTGAIEIKSGYGLSVESELKMLRVIKRLKQRSALTIKSSFLGAHTYPLAYREDHSTYIRMIIGEMLPVIAQEGLADYIDVFCEEGFFSVSEMEEICHAGKAMGLVPKLHVNQLNSIGGLQAALKLSALSVRSPGNNDGPGYSRPCSISNDWDTVTYRSFFLRMAYQPARRIIDAGAAVALASDFNPGSSPSGNMNFVVALSCIQLKMLPEEAINAATINGAFAMGCADELGSISRGKKANIIFTKPVPSIAYLPYAFGNNLIDKVMINGVFI